MKVPWRIDLAVLPITILVIACACSPQTPKGEVPPPKPVGTPTQMIQQCINQPDIPYCKKRCEDAGLFKPRGC